MPKYRKLWTKITQSWDVNDMPDDFTRLLWVLLPLALDREGRGVWNMGWIKGRTMPFRDDVSCDRILVAMEWYVQRGMVVVYEVGERRYFYVPTFKDYQTGTDRESPSILPDPPCFNSRVTHDLLTSNSRVDADEVTHVLTHAASASASEYVSESLSSSVLSSLTQNSEKTDEEKLVDAFVDAANMPITLEDKETRDAIDAMLHKHVIPADIYKAMEVMCEKNFVLRSISSVVNPAIICANQRYANEMVNWRKATK